MKKRRPIDIIRLEATPGSGGLTAYYGATVKDGVEYMHRVCINDEFIWCDGVDFDAFAEMLKAPGDYWPFFCSYCGVPECDNVFSPVRCLHHDDQLILIIRRPLQEGCFSCGEFDDCKVRDERDCPKYHFRYQAYRIAREQLREQLVALQKEFGDHRLCK